MDILINLQLTTNVGTHFIFSRAIVSDQRLIVSTLGYVSTTALVYNELTILLVDLFSDTSHSSDGLKWEAAAILHRLAQPSWPNIAAALIRDVSMNTNGRRESTKIGFYTGIHCLRINSIAMTIHGTMLN